MAISTSGSGGVVPKVITKGSSSLTQKAITVSTTDIELHTGSTRNPNRTILRVYNDGSTACYIGPAGVTAAGVTKGEELVPGDAMTFNIGNAAVHAITARNSTVLIVTEMA